MKKPNAKNVRLFIGGAPGTGKTFTGEALRSRFGWAHFDCEHFHVYADEETFAEFLADPLRFIPKKPKVVVTWGFIPEFVSTVQMLIGTGFQPVWLYGDKDLVDLAVRQRAESNPSAVIQPLGPPPDPEIDMKTAIPSWYEVDTFTPSGERRDVAAILDDRFKK
jgi:hypothetical protein